jgi:hypothetical protein
VRSGELLLRADGKDGALICQAAADPAGVHMGRVASTMRAIADVESGRLAPDAAMKAIGAVSRTRSGAPFVLPAIFPGSSALSR